MSKKARQDIKQLRAIGHKLRPVVTVAGNGLSDAVVAEIDQAFGAMLERTSTEAAPWFAVPADRKWFRNLVITGELVRTLEEIAADRFPPNPELDGVVVD